MAEAPHSEIPAVRGALPGAVSAQVIQNWRASPPCGPSLPDCAAAPGPTLQSANRDPCGATLGVQNLDWAPRKTYEVRSAGPDKKFDTADDLVGYLEVRGRLPVGRDPSGPARIEIDVEHDRGPFNGFAEISGSILDQQGTPLSGATVTAQSVSGAPPRSAVANADGQFTLSALPPGEYDVKVSDGAHSVSRRLALQARDRGVVSAMLHQANAGAVVVAAEPPRRPLPEIARFRKFDMAAVAGAIGGGRPRMMANAMAAPMDRGMAMLPPRPTMPAGTLTVPKEQSPAPAAHVRSYFPEALYINPEIITDREWRRHHRHSPRRFHHHLAHGHDRFHRARRIGQRRLQPQSLSGFLRRSRPSRHSHSGRSRIHPSGRL